MHALAVPFLAAAGLLVVAGAVKLRRPASTGYALRAQGLPGAAPVVRALGALEIAVGALALTGTRAAASGVCLAYLGFSGFVVRSLSRGPASSCGCFGQSDVPPTLHHLALTAALAVCAGDVAFTGSAGLADLRAAGPALGTGVAAAAVVVGWLALLALTALPRLSAAVTLVAPQPASEVSPP